MISEYQQFQNVVDKLADAVFLSDEHGIIHFANKAACSMLSYEHQTLHGRSLKEVDTQIWADWADQNFINLNDNFKPITIAQSLFRSTTGKDIPVDLSISKMTLDGVSYIATFARDTHFPKVTSQYQSFLGKSIENSPIEIYMVSEATLKFIFVNRGARSNTGFSHEELKNMNFPAVCKDLTEESFYQMTAELKSDEKGIIKFEAKLTRKNKEQYPALISVYKTRYLSFNVFIIQAIDTTEKTHHQEQIQEAYEIIDKSNSIAFVWQNEDGLPVSFVSGNIYTSFGYEPEDFLVRKLKYADIIHPEDLQRVMGNFKDLSGNQNTTLIDHEPYRIITTRGNERWVKSSCHIKRDRSGKATHFQGVIEDITSLKRYQDELYRSNTLLEKTFQSISDIVLLLDPQFRIIMINKAGRELLGQSSDEIIGSNCNEYFKDENSVCDYSQEALETQSLISEEIYLKRYKKHFIVSYVPVFNENNEVAYIVNVLRDITERRMMEEQLFLSEKMTTIASLAAGVAHEINTPLSAILQSLQIIQMECDMDRKENRKQAQKIGLDPIKFKEYLESKEINYFFEGMQKSALNAAKIVNNLLNFSRPQKGDIKEESINELLDSSLELARADYDLKKKYDIIDITINREYGSNLPNISCTAMELEQVFLNLIKNSVHALADIPAETEPTITIQTFAEEDDVVIHFEDNGPGMDQKTLSQIFDPFFTTKEIGVGTGLGLTISYSIICDKHSGKMSVESNPGKGTRFTIRLPINRQTEDPLRI